MAYNAKTILAVFAVVFVIIAIVGGILAMTAYKVEDGIGLPPPEEASRRQRRISGLMIALAGGVGAGAFIAAYLLSGKSASPSHSMTSKGRGQIGDDDL